MNVVDQRFLVTGGAGFIGGRVVTQLLEAGAAEVVIYDQRKPDREVEHLGRVRSVVGDLADTSSLRRAVDDCVGVFHMAVLPLGPCEDDPGLCVRVNINGTFNVLEAAAAAGVQKIVFSSASSVYGETTQTMDESHPLNTRTMYGASKIAGEYLLHAFCGSRGIDYVILRYMNVYGPGQSGGVIGNTIARLRRGERPRIMGTGAQSFDFVYVDDIAQANVLAMSTTITGEAFNVGSGDEISIKDVVYLLIEVAGMNVKPEFVPQDAPQLLRRVGSSEKAMRLLGYQPTVPLREGLRRVAADVRGN